MKMFSTQAGRFLQNLTRGDFKYYGVGSCTTWDIVLTM